MASRNNHVKGTATPYLALFDSDGNPIMNTITNLPLGEYITNFNIKYDEEKEDTASITIDTGDPDTVDIDDLQEGSTIYLQWGFILPVGDPIISPVKAIKVKDFNTVFDSTGTHITLKCVDGINSLRYAPGHTPNDEEDVEGSMVNYMDNGCNYGIGIIIKKFDYNK